MKKYCEGLDCAWCAEKEPCIYRIANNLEEQLKAKEQECEELKEARKNSRCAWKSLEGTLCPEAQQQLDQLKAEKEKIEQCLIEQNRLVVGMTKEISDLTHKKYELEHKLNLIKEEI